MEDWAINRPEPAPILGTVSPRVGKEIAHLTYGRLEIKTEEDRQWAISQITTALIDVLNVWLTHATPHVREQVLVYIKDYGEQLEMIG